MKDKSKTPRVGQKSRRRFTKTLAAALVTAPVTAASAVRAQTTPAAREPKAPPNPQTPPPPAAAAATPPQTTPPKPSPVAEAYAGVARALYGKQLNEAEFARVKRDLEGNVRAAERLRASKLKNSDEPDSIFSA
ncbi:MAG: hypothetical protein H0T60_06625 [Acidobacteria bacterium]|nr:hypothetical protein [Acidobacteriota bacterium]